jgi:hypothetical protein
VRRARARLRRSRECLHVERQRSGRLGKYELRVRPEHVGDGCAGQRIVVADVDAEATQVVVAEAPRRTVDGVGDEQMITRREQRQQR